MKQLLKPIATAIVFLMLFVQSSYSQWGLSGNSISSGDFLGTTNNQPLVFKQNTFQVFEMNGDNWLLGPQSFTSQTGVNSFSIGTFGALSGNINGDNSFVIGNSAYNSDSYYNFAIGNVAGNNGGQYCFAFGNNASTGNGSVSNSCFVFGNNSSFNDAQNNKSFMFGNDMTFVAETDRVFAIGNDISFGGDYAQKCFALGSNISFDVLSYNYNRFIIGNGANSTSLTLKNFIDNSLVMGFNSNLATLFVGPSAGANTTGNVGIATTTPGEKLEVNGNVKFSSKMFDLMWPVASTFAGGITGDDNAASASTKLTLYHGNEIMFQTGSNTVNAAYNRVVIDGSGQMGIGALTPGFKLDVDGDINFPLANALKISGTDVLKYDNTNFLLGFGSGTSLISTNYYNTIVGTNAGNTVYSDQNTVIGHDAAYNAIYHPSGTTGDNVIIGFEAAFGMDLSNAEIGMNTYIGTRVSKAAIGSENVHLGYLSGDRTTGNQNTYIGALAGASTTGSYNIAMGYGSEIRGDNNTVIGYEANAYNAGTGLGVTNSTAIGSNAWVESDNTIVLGNSASIFGVEIGFDSWGAAIIGGAPSSCILEVNGNSYTAGSWYPSDANFKKNIIPLSGGLELLRKLNPVNYEFRDDIYVQKPDGKSKAHVIKRNFTKGKQYGFLAQDLEKVIPDMVATRDDGTKMVNYNQLFGVLVKGVQEQDMIVAETQKEMEALKQSNTLLIGMVQDLQKRLNDLTSSPKTDEGQARSFIQQTEPNPFSDQTLIKFYVTGFEKEARLIISDDKAQQLYTFTIDQKGTGQVLLSGNNLSVGTYIAQLMVDGNVVDTQKLILIK